MSKLVLAYCIENQLAASKIITALDGKMAVEKVIVNTEQGIKLLEKYAHDDSNPVLLLISDNFLKSEKCMNEAFGLIQALGNQKRLIPVTTDGIYAKENNGNFMTKPTTFDRVSNVIQYMNYWQDYYLELRRVKPNVAEEVVFSEKVRIVRAISSEIGEMLRYLRAMEYFSFDQFENSHFIILYRVLGLDVPPKELENVKKIAVSHTIYPTERIVEQGISEIKHLENGNGKPYHAVESTYGIMDMPLDPEFDKTEQLEITTSSSENLATMKDHKKSEAKIPISDDTLFEKPDSLEALIEDIKKETLEFEEQSKSQKTDLAHIVDEVVNENDHFTHEIGGQVALKKLEDINSIFDEDAEDTSPHNLQEVYESTILEASFTDIEKPVIAKVVEEVSEDESEIELPKVVLKELVHDPEFDAIPIETPEIEVEMPQISPQEPKFTRHIITKNETTEGVKKDYLTLAKEALEAHRFQEAIEQLENVIENDRTNVTAYMMMAYAAEQIKDYLLSLSCLEKVTLIEPNYPNIYYKLGTLINQHFSGQKRKAIRYFSDALKMDSTNADVYYQLAKLESDNGGDFETVIQHLQDAIIHNPNHADAAFELAKAYYEIGSKEQAATLYARAWTVNNGYKTAINDAIFKYDPPIVEPEPEPEPIAPPVNDNGMVALITGATSGIGRATAEIFAKNGYRLILTGRRSEKLDELKTFLAENHKNKNQFLNFDVRDVTSVKEAIGNLEEDFKNVDILINNAGLASGLSPIHEGDINDWDVMIDTNIKGLLYMTRAVAPLMVARKKGHIINICSIAGKEIYPNGNVYNASKHAVDALTRAMRLDMHKYNIRVSQVSPGAVEETEFSLVRFHGDSEKAKIYEDFTPLKASDVADSIYFIATRPAYVNIQDVVIMCTQQASANHLDRSGRTDR
jgi:NADP-dependent 3-hydroxy acid dehydrogenase YdfG/Flp pilus assembly protein TadD